MNPALLAAIPQLVSLASEYIPDPDKKLEFEAKAQEQNLAFLTTLVSTQTTPWVDAAVKLMSALVALARPVASIGLFVWGLLNPDALTQLHTLGTVGDLAIGAVFGAAPAWGVSRHSEKVAAAKSKQPGFLE